MMDMLVKIKYDMNADKISY